MKALWIMAYDYEYIDKAINAGIDTLLVVSFNCPKKYETDGYDSYEKIIECLQRYQGKVDRYIVPIWNRTNGDLPIDQQFVNDGKTYPWTACITSKDYIDDRVKPALEIYNMGLCEGILWDVEEYLRHLPDDAITTFTEKNKCECSRCKDLSWKEQWKIHQDYMKELLKDVPVTGHMPTREYWSLKRYPNDVQLMLENTYNGLEIWPTIKLFLYKIKNRILYGLKYKLVPGFWVEAMEYDKFFKHIKISKKLFGGYWIFDQRIFSRYSKTTREALLNANCVNVDLVDDDFFTRLKEVNDG